MSSSDHPSCCSTLGPSAHRLEPCAFESSTPGPGRHFQLKPWAQIRHLGPWNSLFNDLSLRPGCILLRVV